LRNMLIGFFFWATIFRGVRHFRGDPYLNSTTVLFDTVVCQKAPLGAKATLNSRKIKSVALCVPFLFESIKLVVAFDGFLLSPK